MPKAECAMKNGKAETYAASILRVAFGIVVAMILSFSNVWADQKIETGVNACLGRFIAMVKGGREMLTMAKGVLVMPSVLKAGLIMGGEYGQGALRIEGKTESYYNLASGSIGLKIGGQTEDIVILFMTDEALKQFQQSKGWEIGLDGSVAVANFGGGKRIADLIKMEDPIIAFVFNVKGLMADICLTGAKFSKFSAE
jgi:lipid-binding SYLF domain-containing protein